MPERSNHGGHSLGRARDIGIRRCLGIPLAGGDGDCFDAAGKRIMLEGPQERVERQLILRLTRDSAVMRPEDAPGGFFQKTLDPNLPCQMVRVAVPAGAPYFAEISGGKHRFTVRFLEVPVIGERPLQTRQDVPFSLGCCII